MNTVLNLILLLLMIQNLTIIDFSTGSDARQWIVVDDVVMGGRSNGQFFLSKEGYAVFKGAVSLENNGGFSSVRHRFQRIDISAYQTVCIRLKGDGNRYQFRLKSSVRDYYAYIAYFETTGKWETIEINLDEMYATFRGRKLSMPNYPGQTLEEVAFLIGNKKPQQFELAIASITLKK
jgi:NADH dehydrogenase [ubiquinone] 1 alpha subcomplex assembly factor 1